MDRFKCRNRFKVRFQFAKLCGNPLSTCKEYRMTAISGSAAAVTGAASGIGRALALELATRGCDLALADRDEAGLLEVAAAIGKAGGRKVTTHRVDVGDAAQIAEFS